MAQDPKPGPLVRAALRVCEQHAPQDLLVLFRVGDFMEAFDEHARYLHDAGHLPFRPTLTKRQGVPMCGLPYYQLDRLAEACVESGQNMVAFEILAKNVEEECPTNPIPQPRSRH